MCGIAGIISLDSELSPDDVREGRDMTRFLRHRGPDGMRCFNDGACFLGNTRLKIIDLSDEAGLPMANADKSVWLSYNGEVTNFKELWKEFALGAKYGISDSSDSRVVLYLYEELGIKMLEYLSGMFALTIYDRRERKVFIVRDFYGIRPLFYFCKNRKLYFASEIKSFLDLGCFRRELDLEAIHHYFSLIYMPGKHTPYRGLNELDGGHLVEIDLGKAQWREKEYYSIRYDTDRSMTEKEAADGFYEVMLDSMRRNMISDVPLGITLSGGIDTSSMVAMSKELGKSRDIHTFSIKIKEPSFDESEYQKIMAHHAGTIHHQVDIDPDDVLKYMIEHVAYMDEPSGNGANIPSYLLAKDASKYVSVLLSGEGGDEISNAYDTHLAYKIRKMYLKHIPDAMRKALFKIAHSLPASYEKLSFDFLAKRFTEGAEKGIPEAHLYWRHVFTEREKKKLLGSSFQRYMPSEKIFADLFNSLDMDDDLNKISLIDLKYFFICDLMVKNDRTFMAHSVEARFPYVDRKVVEFASSIPPEYRIKGFTARYTEKMAMKKILPRKIFKRKSMGLEMPHSLWFFRGLEKLAGKYFTRKKLEADGFFNYEYVNELWQQHLSRERDNGRALWSILNFLIWMDLFVHSSDYKKYLDPYPADE